MRYCFKDRNCSYYLRVDCKKHITVILPELLCVSFFSVILLLVFIYYISGESFHKNVKEKRIHISDLYCFLLPLLKSNQQERLQFKLYVYPHRFFIIKYFFLITLHHTTLMGVNHHSGPTTPVTCPLFLVPHVFPCILVLSNIIIAPSCIYVLISFAK